MPAGKRTESVKSRLKKFKRPRVPNVGRLVLLYLCGLKVLHDARHLRDPGQWLIGRNSASQLGLYNVHPSTQPSTKGQLGSITPSEWAELDSVTDTESWGTGPGISSLQVCDRVCTGGSRHATAAFSSRNRPMAYWDQMIKAFKRSRNADRPRLRRLAVAGTYACKRKVKTTITYVRFLPVARRAR